jgi:hypothetical protein
MTIPEWYLVVSNIGDAPAHNVRPRLEPSKDEGGLWTILGDNPESGPEIEILAPHSEVRFSLIVVVGDAIQARCIVSWTDNRGDRQNTATVRLT